MLANGVDHSIGAVSQERQHDGSAIACGHSSIGFNGFLIAMIMMISVLSVPAADSLHNIVHRSHCDIRFSEHRCIDPSFP